MPPEQRVGIESELLTRKKMKAEGVELQRGSDGSTWELTAPSNVADTNGAPAPRKKILITIENAIEHDNDALVIIDARPDPSATADQAEPEPHRRQSALVRMKFEDGEWRITDVGEVQQVSLEDVLRREVGAGDSSPRARESSAVGALRTLNTAIVAIKLTIRMSGCPPVSRRSPAGQTKLATSLQPHMRPWSIPVSQHRRSSVADMSSSTHASRLTATPLSPYLSTAAPRSFFTDESGVIRFTQETSAATAQDAPLQ